MLHEPSKVEVLGTSSLDVSIAETADLIPGYSPCVAHSKTWSTWRHRAPRTTCGWDRRWLEQQNMIQNAPLNSRVNPGNNKCKANQIQSVLEMI